MHCICLLIHTHAHAHRLEVTLATTARDVVKSLVRRIGTSHDSSMFFLELFYPNGLSAAHPTAGGGGGGGGSSNGGGACEKRIADDCRPLLMLPRWETSHAQLFLRLDE